MKTCLRGWTTDVSFRHTGMVLRDWGLFRVVAGIYVIFLSFISNAQFDIKRKFLTLSNN